MVGQAEAAEETVAASGSPLAATATLAAVNAQQGLRRCQGRAFRAVVASGWLPLTDILVLQLTSLAVCVDCRQSQRPLQVNVAKRTPETLWSNKRSKRAPESSDDGGDEIRGSAGSGKGSSGKGAIDGGGSNRIPRPNIAAILWNRASPCPALYGELPSEARRIAFGGNFNQPVTGITWPRELEQVSFGSKFAHPIAGVSWPVSLKRISLADSLFFDHSLSGVDLPEGLREISFGAKFNQPLPGEASSAAEDNVESPKWPSTLERIYLRSYGRSLTTVCWPQGLRALAITGNFDLPLDGVCFPSGLEQLEILSIFNHPINGVNFPRSLKVLSFGNCFNQKLHEVVFPAELQELIFGLSFDQPLQRVELPASLTHLALNSNVFNHAVEAITWPGGMRELYFGDAFNRDVTLVAWPADLVRLVFGDRFNKPVQAIAWPSRLEELRFGRNFNQPVTNAIWPSSLKRLHFGARFKQCLSGAIWPRGLEILDLSDCHMRWSYGRKEGYENWPPSLEIISRRNIESLGWKRKGNRGGDC